MNRMLLSLALVCLAVTGLILGTDCQAALMAGDTVSEDFNANVNNWTIAKVGGEPVTFTQDPNGGVDTPASGGALFSNFSTANGSNDASVIYTPAGVLADGRIDFNPGNTITSSISFQVDDSNIAATPRLGIVADDGFFSLTDRNVIGGGGTNHTGITVLTTTSADKFLQVRNAAGAAGTTNAVSATELPFNTGEWFTFHLSIDKSNVANEFVATGSVDRLNADGTAVDVAGYLSVPATTFTNAALYSASDVFIGFHSDASNAPLTHAGEFDNFNLTVVPEPATLMLMYLCGIVALGARPTRS